MSASIISARAVCGRVAPSHPARSPAPELVALAALLGAYLCSLLLGTAIGDPARLRIAFLVPLDALVIVSALRAADRSQTPQAAAFWRALALAWGAELAGDLTLGVYEIGLADPAYPAPADLFYLAFYPLALIALLRLPSLAARRTRRLDTLLDCAIVVVGGGAAIWYFVLGPTILEDVGSSLELLVASAYPVGDLVLLGAISLALMRPGPPGSPTRLRLIAVGFLVLIVADTAYGYQQLHDAYRPGGWIDALYVLMAVPFILAAVRREPEQLPEPTSRDELELHPRTSRLPLLASAVGFGMLAATQWRDPFFPDLSLLVFAGILVLLVVVRQHTAQRELLSLQARVRTIVESVAEGIVTFGESGRVVWANPTAERSFSAPPGGLLGVPVDSLYVGSPWSETVARLGGSGPGAGGESILGERRRAVGRRLDGTSFPLELVVTEASLDGERVLIAIGQDVSERESAEAALRESEERFRGIFDNAALGIAFSSLESGTPRILDVNPAFSALFGYEAEELRGKDFSAITHDPDDLAALGAATAAGDDLIEREIRCREKEGRVIWAALTVSILRDEDGAPRFAIGMLEDVTRRKEAERLKDEFASVIGHELRTPLASIRGSLGLIEGGVLGELPAEAAAMVETAVTNSDRLVRLLDDVLDLERMEAGRSELRRTLVGAQGLIASAFEVVAQVAAEAGVELRVAGEDAILDVDPDRILQTLINLLGNAIKFSASGSAVTVEVGSLEGDACLSVIDRGRGIPADQLGTIFERFAQVDGSDAREKGGTGLGLAISRGIVEEHGGRIWAESEEGRGSVFSFSVPLAAQVPA